MTTKRVIALIIINGEAQIVPLNVRWSQRYTYSTNIARYVLPILGVPSSAVLEIALTRSVSWTGSMGSDKVAQRRHDELLAASQRNELGNIDAYHRAIYATESDDSLWIGL